MSNLHGPGVLVSDECHISTDSKPLMIAQVNSLDINSKCICWLTAHQVASRSVHTSPCAADTGGSRPRRYKPALLW